MTFTEFLFWLVIFGGPLGLVAWIMWQHLRETRRRWAAAEFIQAGREHEAAHGDVPHIHHGENYR